MREEQSLWVGFSIPLDVAQTLAVTDGEPADKLHITLAYLGGIENYPEDSVERAEIALRNLALTYMPFDVQISGISRFRGGDKDVIYATVSSPDSEIQYLHDRVCSALRDAGLAWISNYSEYIPHVTLKYVPRDSEYVHDGPVPNITVTVDALTLNPSRTVIPLTMPRFDGAPLVMAEFVEPPVTIPVLPVPGTYKHPTYGDLDMTPERLDRFVRNFQAQVYQDRVPIDLEHDTKLSGAAGWITDLVPNEDGSVDALVEWTDMGREALLRNRYRYVSPEWYTQWTSPIDGVKYEDVLIGAALTTRPFFKPPALRSLAATEENNDMGTGTGNDNKVTLPSAPAAAPAPAPKADGANASVSESFSELQEKVASLTAAKTASDKLAEEYSEGLKRAHERIAAMEAAAQNRRFTEEVLGKSDSNNLRWFGEIEGHIRILTSLAAAEGEDSDAFKAYVAQNRAFAEQMQKSKLFEPAGSSNPGTGSADPQTRINALATARASEKNISFRDAIAQIANENPDLYREAGRQASVRV